MASRPKPTRAERRAARAEVPDARVYGVRIQDTGASSWISEVLVFAQDRDAAKDRLRAVGMYKRVITADALDKHIDAEGRQLATDNPSHVLMRQLDDDGWTRWFALLPGYVHPPQDAAAKDPSLRLEPPSAD